MVSADFFSLLGSNAAIGRTFNSGEDQPGQDGEVLISHRYWAANFASDRGLVGLEILINGRKHTVIGIMPPDFNYPIGIDMWAPLALTPAQWVDRETPMLHVIGKLRGEFSLRKAAAEMKTAGDRLATQFPRTNSDAKSRCFACARNSINTRSRCSSLCRRPARLSFFLFART